MRNQFFSLFLLAGLVLTACQNSNSGAAAVDATEATAAAATAAEAANYTVDAAASVVNWEGYKPGQYSHYGTMKVQGGQVGIKDGLPVSGNFVIDVASLASSEDKMPADDKAKLEGHLKTGDFFEVEKFPTGSFEVTGVAPLSGDANANCKLTGNLTLKGVTKSVEIPAQVTVTEGKVMVQTPEFTINRTDWGIKYSSGLIGTVKDKIIADDVKLKITLVANAG